MRSSDTGFCAETPIFADMKQNSRPPFSTRERNGMIALVTIILAITGCGVALRTCRGTYPGEPGQIVLCDTLPDRAGQSYSSGERMDRGKKRASSGKAKKTSGKKKNYKKKNGENKEKGTGEPSRRNHLEENLSE